MRTLIYKRSLIAVMTLVFIACIFSSDKIKWTLVLTVSFIVYKFLNKQEPVIGKEIGKDF